MACTVAPSDPNVSLPSSLPEAAQKSAGHAGDGLASMRTHSTPVKSAGHAGDGLASMRTHPTPVKSAGHSGDGLASMRTHSTPMKSAGGVSARPHSTTTAVQQKDPILETGVPNFSAAADPQPST